MKTPYMAVVLSIACAAAGSAQSMTQRANITGNAQNGKCTIEVLVDGAAEVEVQGDTGRIRNLSGQRASWRRFVCNGRMPANPQDFRFRGIDGRGQVQLVADPRQNGGRVVFRIEDPQGGREGYTVDLEWRGSNGGQWNSQDTRGWMGPDSRGGGMNRDRWPNNDNARWTRENSGPAIRACQNAVTDRIQREGFREISFGNVVPDNNPGRNDRVTGRATARRGRRSADFQFSCAVNMANAQVRSVELERR